MSAPVLQFMVRAKGTRLECSKCDTEVELVVTLPLKGVLLPDGREAFLGLCEPCTISLAHGFVKAKANLAKLEGE